jgi:hypothetical protein
MAIVGESHEHWNGVLFSWSQRCHFVRPSSL